jgi:CheY-like chemotaxis protein
MGRGSAFTLYLPVAFGSATAPASLHVEPSSGPKLPSVLTGRTVLVVDDDLRNAFAIRSLLEKRGMTVFLAEGARASLDVLQKHPDIDLILMDIMMPEIDGYDATRSIRAIEAYREMPVIALTSKAMIGDREKVLAAGCSDFIAKPVDSDQLVAVMSRWLAA